ncbi:glycine--tRNA ligase subunit beta [Cytobacillus sp. Hz8]|uniref:glycine--tRNA ligase subunit beta n=1 Tax=Cytobacillus sp. Hz8 TaxID=3347168 RepID=UPI0035E02162
MSKHELLLEIGLEEMPARFVTNSINQLTEKLETWLRENKIGFGEIQSFSTPRRLAVFIQDIAESQEDIHEEAKGPAKKIALDEKGEWTKAAQGFCRGQGMSVEDIYFKEINGVEYAHVQKFIQGQATKLLLSDLQTIITSLTFPKNMRWADKDLRYIRPIKWIVAMFDQEVIPFTIAGVETSNWTLGHRFLGKKIVIDRPADYEKLLLGQYVMANAEERKKAILSQLDKLQEENNWLIPIDEELLEEVNNLVEYPTVLFGHFEEEFLDIPESVLITSMKEHQRYFPVKSKDGDLLPYFVTVRNGDHHHLDTVARGNEKVLRARLADAAFFYKEDQKIEINTALARLENIVYHDEIGTLSSKVQRVRELTNRITNMLNFSVENKAAANRAAEICKFDLVTNMVYEFPELQGFMGERYALQKGETNIVAKAINEHYMPRNADDDTPASDVGAALSIADKLDTIASFFAIGMIPSGSQDPYALRRQATGIVQTLLHKEWNVKIEDLVEESLRLIVSAGFAKKEKAELTDEILSFLKLRVKYVLQECSIRYDIIEAVLTNEVGIISSLVRKAEVLDKNKDQNGFKESIEALSRVLSISSKAENEGEVNPKLFESNDEFELYNKYLAVKVLLSQAITEEDYFDLLISMKDEINQYFDHTMVMAEDEKLRENRLNLMVKISQMIKQFANVKEIIVK